MAIGFGTGWRISELVKLFPKDELFKLTSQIKRAADSVVLNITEGSILQSKKKFAKFLVIANRLALEVIACLYLSKRRSLVNEPQFKHFYDNYEKLVVMIQALIRTLHDDEK